MLNKTIVILGPTCTGKTSLALNLCQRFDGAIISADSRQVVRLMDIGTGKVPAGENDRRLEKLEDKWVVDGVDIFGYDLVNPDEYFSAYDFVKYFQSRHNELTRLSATFLVGGTGFYIDAVTGRTTLAEISPNMELRKSLEKLSTEELAKKLFQLDESLYKSIDTKNPARLVRAIEKATPGLLHCVRNDDRNDDGPSSRVPMPWRSEIASRLAMTPPDPVFIGLTAEREILYSRADKWVDTIFNEKLFEEIKLIQTRFPKSHRLNGLIYKSAIDYLNGVTVLEDAKQKAKFAMHAYIRRQQTWFKRNNEIKWLDISDKNFDSKANSIVESSVDG